MLKIVEYTDAYKENVTEMLIEIILNEFDMQERIEDIKEYDYNSYKVGGGNFWIAIDENNNVHATIGIQNDIQRKEAKLVRMYMRQEYRGCGVSRKLLNLAIEYVKGLNYDKIVLGTYKKLERAIAFYEKNGFREYNKIPAIDGEAKFYVLKF